MMDDIKKEYIMKALVLTDHFKQGGAERVAALVINALSANDEIDVHVCIFENANNYNVDQKRICVHLLTDARRGHFANAFLKVFNLAKVMKDVKPDVTYSFGPIMAIYVFLAKLLSGVRRMRVVDSERNDPRYEPVENWKKTIRNFCYNRADVIVCQTPMAAELLTDQYGVGTPKVIIPNPISPNLPIWEGTQSKEIITAARLTKQKNIPLLIDAFELLHKVFPDYHLTIYGEGELRPFLTEYIKAKNLSGCISLPGFSKNIHQVMSSAYMYVSSSDYEGISNSMLEALGIGLPCVCTDCPVGGAALHIIDGKNGLLTKVGDVEGLYIAMKRLVENPADAKKMSLESRLINDEISLDKIANKWLEVAL